MIPSQNFFDLVKAFEGLKLTAYQDVAGIWTIGYGTTTYPDGGKVREGDTCDEDQAEVWLTKHIAGAVIPPVNQQGEYDACLDFIYNVGQSAFNASSLCRDVIANAAADTITTDFCMWDKAHINGELVEVPGLLRRRKCEAYLYNNGQNHPTFFL